MVAVAGAAGLASLALCITGLYSTVGLNTLADRMELTAPLSTAFPVVGVMAIAMVITAAVAGRAASIAGPADG